MMTLWKCAIRKQAVVKLEVGGRHRHQHPGHAADDEGAHETDGPQDRHSETNAPAVFRRIDPMIFCPVLDGFFDDNLTRFIPISLSNIWIE
jgi:hypothetical protein